MTIEQTMDDEDKSPAYNTGISGMQIYLVGLMALGLLGVTLILFIDNL